jgi:hypothetical protein
MIRAVLEGTEKGVASFYAQLLPSVGQVLQRLLQVCRAFFHWTDDSGHIALRRLVEFFFWLLDYCRAVNIIGLMFLAAVAGVVDVHACMRARL